MCGVVPVFLPVAIRWPRGWRCVLDDELPFGFRGALPENQEPSSPARRFLLPHLLWKINGDDLPEHGSNSQLRSAAKVPFNGPEIRMTVQVAAIIRLVAFRATFIFPPSSLASHERIGVDIDNRRIHEDMACTPSELRR